MQVERKATTQWTLTLDDVEMQLLRVLCQNAESLAFLDLANPPGLCCSESVQPLSPEFQRFAEKLFDSTRPSV